MNSVLCLVAIILNADTANWPGFRGPDGTGASASAKPPLSWNTSKGVFWKMSLPGPGSSSPIIYGDRVFVTCYTGTGGSLKRHLLCFDKISGKQNWTADVPAVLPEDPYSGYITEHGYASSTPVTDGNAVYLFFGKSGVLAFAMDGKKLWQTSVGTGSDIRRWGSSASPILYKNLVIVNAASESRAIVALDAKTGRELWKSEGDRLSLSFSTPALVEANGRTDLVVAMPEEVWGMNPETGKLRWTATIAATGNVCPAVVPGEGIAYVTGGFQAKGTSAIKAGGKGDVTQSNVPWTARRSCYVPTPVLNANRLFMVTEDGIAISMSSGKGDVLQEQRLSVPAIGGRGSRPFYASPVVADGHIFAVSRRAGVFVLKADDTLKQIGLNPPLDDSDFNASPAMSGGLLLLRSNTFLYALGSP